jgi:hypothetical protein
MDKEFEKVISKIESHYLHELKQNLEILEKAKKDFEEISTKIISIFVEKDMTYEDAYWMLDLVSYLLKLKSTKVKL